MLEAKKMGCRAKKRLWAKNMCSAHFLNFLWPNEVIRIVPKEKNLTQVKKRHLGSFQGGLYVDKITG